MSSKDYYEILGVPCDASDEEIKGAYRALARRFHPDVTSDPDGEARFKEINEANENLSDSTLRQIHDAEISNRGLRFDGRMTSFDDFFGMGDMDPMQFLFGGPKVVDGIGMTPHGWGLLNALTKIYEKRGKWKVRTPESDTRGWMPGLTYKVHPVNDRPHIFRIIKDWREARQRESSVILPDGSEKGSGIMLGEYWLVDRIYRLRSSGIAVPADYGSFIGALKDIAHKIFKFRQNPEGIISIGSEANIINRYSAGLQGRYPETIFDGVSMGDVGIALSRHEGLVRSESSKGPEGQRGGGPERGY